MDFAAQRHTWRNQYRGGIRARFRYAQSIQVDYNVISPDYFQTLGVPVLKGVNSGLRIARVASGRL